MSRILEFQPTDEQTIVARVLVELHQAIDVSFPNAKPSARQFSRTVLTNQGESTRIDNVPQSSEERAATAVNEGGHTPSRSQDKISMTPRTGVNAHDYDSPLHTGQLRSLLGESHAQRILQKALVVLLLIGILIFVWLAFVGPEMPFSSQ
jgi:hypothetical protein